MCAVCIHDKGTWNTRAVSIRDKGAWNMHAVSIRDKGTGCWSVTPHITRGWCAHMSKHWFCLDSSSSGLFLAACTALPNQCLASRLVNPASSRVVLPSSPSWKLSSTSVCFSGSEQG